MNGPNPAIRCVLVRERESAGSAIAPPMRRRRTCRCWCDDRAADAVTVGDDGRGRTSLLEALGVDDSGARPPRRGEGDFEIRSPQRGETACVAWRQLEHGTPSFRPACGVARRSSSAFVLVRRARRANIK
nr:MAG: hypothetical protein DIU78_14880 [Pseudomonadota bacterium]